MQYIPNTKHSVWCGLDNHKFLSWLTVYISFNLHKTQGGEDIAKEILKRKFTVLNTSIRKDLKRAKFPPETRKEEQVEPKISTKEGNCKDSRSQWSRKQKQ